MLVIDNVFVLVLLSDVKVNSQEPLICKVVKLHIMSCLPLVHRTTEFHFVIPWSSVVKHENMRFSIVFLSVELAHDIVNFNALLVVNLAWRTTVVNIVINGFGGTLIKITCKDLSLLLCTKDLLNNADWLVVLRIPSIRELLHLQINNSLVNEFLISQTTELIEPCPADYITIHGRSESILSELIIFLLIQIGIICSLNCLR